MGDTSESGGFSVQDVERLATIFQKLALDAGKAILKIYGSDLAMRHKADMSPVSDADELSEAIILEGLQAQVPEVPVISEEAVSRGVVPETGDTFILVDPLDGTREFFARNGEFTVNIALVHRQVPILGVVHSPVPGDLWVGGCGDGGHCFARKFSTVGPDNPARASLPSVEPMELSVRARDHRQMVALASRSHLDEQTQAFIDDLPRVQCRRLGSSLKFCLIAEGGADVYPRFGPTMEWDTAAGDAVLRAAGGIVVAITGEPLVYGKPGFRNCNFIAWGQCP